MHKWKRQYAAAALAARINKFFLHAHGIKSQKNSPILGTAIKVADLRHKWNCLVAGLERGAYTITNPNVSLVFEENDLLWVLGKQK